MSRRIVRGGAAAATLAMLAWSGTGRAQQLDLNPPVPNVLLLLDNSGSMERMIDGTLPEQTPANNCNCTTSTTCDFTKSPPPNRWGTVQQALTGQLTNGYNCIAMARTSGSDFDHEYQINGISPYDLNYALPFHRMVAEDTTGGSGVPCVVAPGILPGAQANQGAGLPRLGTGPGHSADEFVTGDLITRKLGEVTAGSNTCSFTQLNNGAISTMSQLMRFGLMTFDTDTLPNTGVSAGGVGLLVGSPPFPGMWSYFPGWDLGGTPPSGRPANCTTAPQPWAVGARNPAAPPWEGRMVRFPLTGDTLAQQQTNSNIADVIRASRPYGATPLAGMLSGAQYYFWTDPKGPQQTDAFVQGDCRPEFIILLTDGAPNQDMRPDCAAAATSDAGGNGICPFDLPENTVATLWNNGHAAGANQFVKTYVIGFAVSKFDDASSNTVQCSSLVTNGMLSSACATATPDSAFSACCELEKIAIAGGSNHAFFADTPGDLQAALASILAEISTLVTTRTVPAYSPVVTNVLADPTGQTPNSEVFFASFSPNTAGPWTGKVIRSRFFCQSTSGSSSPSSSQSSSSSGSSTTVAPPGSNPAAGDFFDENMNTNSPARTFIAMQPTVPAHSNLTLRPFVPSTVRDGLSTEGIAAFAGGNAANVVGNITPDALGIPMTGTTQGCPYTPNNATTGTKYLDPTTCRNMLLDFTFGVASTSFSGPADFSFTSRFGNALGDIYHATPLVVGPPGSLLQDPSYQAFRLLCSTGSCGSIGTSGSGSSGATTSSQRPTIVYAPTNDGLLHAFWADETTLENNERWAMLLPAAMPNLQSAYPAGHQFLLDGSPVVKDTVWDRAIGAQSGTVWHTTLAAGYGRTTGGYYAVEVTNPDPKNVVGQPVQGSAITTPPSGPMFRWQLMPTADNTAFQIFGKQSATPAVTTLFMDPGDGNGAREIGVAILPGGTDGPAKTTTQCARTTKVATDFTTPPAGYAPRTSVRCWGSLNAPGVPASSTDAVNGRSVSIVRLDTGEVLRTFVRAADLPATNPPVDPTRVTDTPFDSPMTGTPIVFPVDVGADATKAFITDADGTMWRIDLSSPTPANWKATLFLDLYNQTVDTNTTTSWQDGQPTSVDPVLSLDPAGRLVLNVATGTTDAFDNTGVYYVYSITEQVSGSALAANVNWFLGPGSNPSALRQGERVSGPMTVFNGTLFFATYFAGSSLSCSSGDARVWGMDFEVPFGGANCAANPDPCRGNGGVFSASISATNGFIDPGATNPGRVIPGVAIQATPACGTFSTRTDGYVAGVSHMAGSSYTPGSYALVMPMSAGGGATQANPSTPPTLPLQTPLSPTLIDSWAAVLE
jgi:type IV pilus assembly protein PilY1